MFRSMRTAAVLAALAFAGCSDVSGPVDPSAAPRRNAGSADNPPTTTTDSTAARGIHLIGGG